MPGYEGYEITHNKDGSITFVCSPAEPGMYKISVEHNGLPLVGLPMCCVVQRSEDGYVTAYKTGDEFDEELAQTASLQVKEGEEDDDQMGSAVDIVQAAEQSIADQSLVEDQSMADEKSMVEEQSMLEHQPMAEESMTEHHGLPDEEAMADQAVAGQEGVQALRAVQVVDANGIQSYEFVAAEPGDPEQPEIWPESAASTSHDELPREIVAVPVESGADESFDALAEELPMDIPIIKQETLMSEPTRRRSARSAGAPLKFEDFVTPTSKQTRSPIKRESTLAQERLANVEIVPPPELDDTLKKFPCGQQGCTAVFSRIGTLKKHEATHEERLLICEVLDCKRQFKVTQTLLDHRASVHNLDNQDVDFNSIPCSVRGCKSKVPSIESLRKHLDKDHKSMKDVICPHCPRVCKNAGRLEEHLQTHSEEPNFECTYEDCNVKFKTKRMYEVHLKNHNGKALCDDCGKTFASQGNLNKHVENQHRNPKPRKVNLSGIRTPRLTYNEEKTLMCDSCGKFFKNKSSLKNHLREMHVMEEMKVIENDSLMPYRPFKCKYCGQGFKRVAVMRAHVAIHESHDLIPCPQVGCKKSFPTTYKMKDHIRTVHKHEDKRYHCTIPNCNKVFKQIAGLNVHMRKHNNERFPCPDPNCELTFSTKFCAITHHQVKHEKLDLRHVCQICNKGYRLKIHLNRHMTTHTNSREHMCLTCGKTFKTKTTLNSHTRTHDIDRQYSCDYCEKIFPRKYRLLDHIKMVHTAAVQDTMTDAMTLDMQNTITQLDTSGGKHILVIEQVELPQDMEI